MYLKSIEVHGFKSFANKTVFQFHNGITGIVGPNGSGKSNVADAVRWVLGEQSAKTLRGSNMQDVIFSGTEARRPLGYASVSITLDNSDHQLPVSYDEVTVARRVFRSGESEYLLNGTQVRLKDINELFYDTGIGKEGYSIIGQGQVEKILNGKPEERRELFDEAVGIVKYKRRKIAAVKKLDEEKNNLTRINDILSELTRQIGPLEKQAEKARIFLDKREELKSREVRLFLAEDDRLAKELESLDERLQTAEAHLTETKDSYEKAKEEYDRQAEELEAIEKGVNERREAVTKARIYAQELENQQSLQAEQIRTLQQGSSIRRERETAILRELDELKKQQVQSGTDREDAESMLEEARKKEQEALQVSEKIQDIILRNTQIVENSQAELLQLINDRTVIRAGLQRQDTLLEQIEIRKAQITQQILSAKSSEELQETELEGLREDCRILEKKIEEENSQSEEKSNRLADLQQSLSSLNQETETEQVQYHREASRLESLRNIAERYDGYGNSIRKVMEQRSSHPGIRGVVADLITTKKQFETAIETALGGNIQNIVTDTEETAKEMIRFLKEGKYGRATFLPLDGLTVRQDLRDWKKGKEPGVIGAANTLVETDPSYQILADYLLGRTLVVDTIDHALQIARKNHHTLRIVTLEGELLNPGGSMTGGAFRNTSNLLGRRREIEELQKVVEGRSKHLNSLQEQIDLLRHERNMLRDELVKARDRMQDLYLQQNTADLKLKEMTGRQEETLNGYETLRKESKEIEHSVREIEEEKAKIRGKLAESARKEQELEQEIRMAQAALERHKPAREEASRELENARVRLASLAQQAEFRQKERDRIETEIERRNQEQESLRVENGKAEEEIHQKEDAIEAIKVSIKNAEEQVEILNREKDKMEQERTEKNAVQRSFFEKREELSEQMRLLDRECFRLTSQKEKITEQKESQINYMWEEYSVTRSDAAAFGHDKETIRIPEQKRAIQKIKAEIRDLGNVNVGAIEEYREVSERHTFLSGQHDDLVRSQEALEKIILELDQGMRTQFRSQFARIQEEFNKTFRELFGGGKGTLELTEEEDILDAGIRIIAQPPGKKLQNMMQLSGGEKALTAIALLFAIQNLKPSPFCLLDEIEAALDENNVVRFAKYLHKLTKNTQFIIITHRRGSMTAADRLYGITMQEKGVSALVSVNLIEEQLDA